MKHTVFVDFHHNLADLSPAMPLLNPFIKDEGLALFGGRNRAGGSDRPQETARRVVRYLRQNRIADWQLILILKISNGYPAETQNDTTALRQRLGYQLKIMDEAFIRELTSAGHEPERTYAFVFDDQERTGYLDKPDEHHQMQEWMLDNKGYVAHPIKEGPYLYSMDEINAFSASHGLKLDLTGERTDSFDTLSDAKKEVIENHFSRLQSDFSAVIRKKMEAAAGTWYVERLQRLEELFLNSVAYIRAERIDLFTDFQPNLLMQDLLRQTFSMQAFKHPQLVPIRIPIVARKPKDTVDILIRLAYLIGLFAEQGDTCLHRFDPDLQYYLLSIYINEDTLLRVAQTYHHRLTDEQTLLRRNMDCAFSASLELYTDLHCAFDRNITVPDVDLPRIRKGTQWHEWVNQVQSRLDDTIETYTTELEQFQTHISKATMQPKGEQAEDINAKIEALDAERRQCQQTLAKYQYQPLHHEWDKVMRPIDNAVRDWFGCHPTWPRIVVAGFVAALIFVLPLSATYAAFTHVKYKLFQPEHLLNVLVGAGVVSATAALLCWWRRRKLHGLTRSAYEAARLISKKVENGFKHNVNHIKALGKYQVAVKNHERTHKIQRQLSDRRSQMLYHEAELEHHIQWASNLLDKKNVPLMDTGQAYHLDLESPVVLNPVYFPCVYADDPGTIEADIYGAKNKWKTKRLIGLEKVEFIPDPAYPEGR